MEDIQHEQAHDDLEIEIIDVPDAGASMFHSSAANFRSSSRSLLQPGFMPRHRLLQASVTTSIVVVALLCLLGGFTPVRNAAQLTLFGPSAKPTPALAPGSNLFYFRADPPWGHLVLDGHTLAHLPVVGSDPPLQLAPGLHQIVWDAVPFKAQHCSISLPPAANTSTNTCTHTQNVYVKPGVNAQVISLHDSLATLQPGFSYNALMNTAQASLDALRSTAIVRPGEMYLNEQNHSSTSIATQPLRATLDYQFNFGNLPDLPCGSNIFCVYAAQNCYLLCSIPSQQPQLIPPTWNVAAVVQTTWTYTTLDGRVVSRAQSDASLWPGAVDHIVTLHIQWNGSKWHVTLLPVNPFEDAVGNLACASTEDEVNYNTKLAGTWHVAPDPNSADGCLAVATVEENDGGLSAPSHPVVAYCLHRFGIFLAVNDVAHRLWPFMPLADSYEKQLANGLQRQPGWTFSVPPFGPSVSFVAR